MRRCGSCFEMIPDEGPCPSCGYDNQANAKKYPFALSPGTLLNGRYVTGRVLGQGGFGITYLAMDDWKQERVAVKEYFPSGLSGRGQDRVSVQIASAEQLEEFNYGKEQFLSEARTLSRFMELPSIVRVDSTFEENGTAYFVMEYIEGKSLMDSMQELGHPLTEKEADELLMPVMKALEAVHAKGIIHRDLSPDNIMITKDGAVKLIDFGAARYSTGEKSKSLDVVLKHGFAPMEQYTRRGRQGPFTDVYAMAATYYYAVTGKVPLDAVERIQADELQAPRSLGAKIRPATEKVLLHALAVDYNDRIQTMEEFRRELEAAEKGRLPGGGKGKKTGLIAAVVCAALTLAVGAGVLFLRPAPKTEPAETAEPIEAAPEEVALPEETLSPEQEQEQRYLDALAKLEQKDYAGALEDLEALGDYKDAAEQITPTRYALALQEVENGSYPSALADFELLGDYEDASFRVSDIQRYPAYLREAEPGSSFFFGHYEQDCDEWNGTEPIEWILLDRDGDRALLLSRYVLDSHIFHTESSHVYWETSLLRKWMNTEFLQAAFSEEEQQAILTTEVDNSGEQSLRAYKLTGGKNTQDKVYCLSYAEVRNFFPDDGTRLYEDDEYYEAGDETLFVPYASTAPTAYAMQQDVYHFQADNSFWWLRSPGKEQNLALYVNGYDQIEEDYVSGSDRHFGIRPVLWLDLNAEAGFADPALPQADLRYEAAAALEESGDLRAALKAFRAFGDYRGARERVIALGGDPGYLAQIEKGDPVFFGSYEQDGEDGSEPIEWIVLEKQKDKVLLISHDILEKQSMLPAGSSADWEKSDMRAWLNDQFLNSAFTPEEQGHILLTTLDNSRSAGYTKAARSGGQKTEDRIFLLSYKEAKTYFAAPGVDPEKMSSWSSMSEGARKHVQLASIPAMYCSGNGHTGEISDYWLRSPGEYDDEFLYCSCFDYEMTGEIWSRGVQNGYGVRPALWLDLNMEP